MNMKLRRIIGVGVSVLLLGICQMRAPLTRACVVSVVVTVAFFMAANVILRRKGWLEMKTENPLIAPVWIPLWIAVIGNSSYNISTFDHTRNWPFLQQTISRCATFIQWLSLFLLVNLMAQFVIEIRQRRHLP